jgi:HPt (histidine-containing phosphotransfer) domain-containing protein
VFTTQAHALKSAAGTIGAEKISAEAEALEAAGKAGDLAAIGKILPGFYGRLAELIAGIGDKVKSEDSEVRNEDSGVGSGEDESSSIPHSSLFTLKEALETKNMKEVDRLLEEMEELPLDAETRDQLNGISDGVLMGEYGGAIAVIEAIMGEKKTHDGN